MQTYNGFNELAANTMAASPRFERNNMNVFVSNSPTLVRSLNDMDGQVYDITGERLRDGRVRVIAIPVKDSLGGNDNSPPFYVKECIFDNPKEATEGMTRLQQGRSWDTGQIIHIPIKGD